MATKTIIPGYQEVTHILPADILDMQKLTAAGGRVIEEFEVEVQRAKLETDYLVKIAVPADKIDEFGGHAVDYAGGKWLVNPVKKEDHAITEEVEVPDPDPEDPATIEPTPDPDPLAQLEAALGNRELAAKRAITRLKATAAAALVMGGMSEGQAYVAGSALVVEHSARIQAYILAGGNPVAAQALLDAIDASPPAWWSEPMEAIFAAGLGL